MMMGVTTIGSMFILTANILVDIAYAFLDPSRPLLTVATASESL